MCGRYHSVLEVFFPAFLVIHELAPGLPKGTQWDVVRLPPRNENLNNAQINLTNLQAFAHASLGSKVLSPGDLKSGTCYGHVAIGTFYALRTAHCCPLNVPPVWVPELEQPMRRFSLRMRHAVLKPSLLALSLPQLQGAPQPLGQPVLIFALREGNVEERRISISQTAELEAQSRSAGFETRFVSFKDLSVVQTARLLQQASVYAGVEGADFVNSLLGPHGIGVMQLHLVKPKEREAGSCPCHTYRRAAATAPYAHAARELHAT